MRMTRAWLILADILVTLLLFLSFTLYYLYPLQTSPTEGPAVHSVPVTLPLTLWDTRITFESIEKAAQHEAEYKGEMMFDLKALQALAENEETAEEIMESYLLEAPLSERLDALSAKMGDPIYIRIFKAESLLEVWIRTGERYSHLKNYFICAYSGELGPKEREGDRQSPEGFYSVTASQLNPHSKFHLSFNLGYPNAYDRAHARTGSFLMVHGNCVSIGCYAMTDAKIEEIYALVEAALKKGEKRVPVHIYPFRMTQENMAAYSTDKWYGFWKELQAGYDYFSVHGRPPAVKVKGKHYVIEGER